MQFLLRCTLIFAILHFGTCAIDDEKFYQIVQPYLDLLASKDVLTFNDRCDPAFEELRKVKRKELLDLVSRAHSFGQHDFKNSVTNTITTMAMVSGNYCNSSSNLQCNAKGKCDCAQVDESFGSTLTLERAGEMCLISSGSICLPMDTIDTGNPENMHSLLHSLPKQEYRCASTGGCIIKDTELPCTAKAIQEAIQKIALKENVTEIAPAFRLQKAKEGICICAEMGWSNLALPEIGDRRQLGNGGSRLMTYNFLTLTLIWLKKLSTTV